MSATLAAPPTEGLATVAQAAEFLSLSKSAVYELMDCGRLEHCRFPGTKERCTRRIPWRVLREFVERNTVGATGR